MAADITAPLNAAFGASHHYGTIDRNEDEVRWSGFVWLGLSALAVGLGNSLEPMSVFSWIHPFLLIVGFEKTFSEISKRGIVVHGYDCALALTALATVLILTLGMTLGFAGALGYPETSVGSVALTFIMCLFWWLTLVCLVVVPSHVILKRYPNWVATPFVFVVLYITTSVCVLGETLSTFACIGNSVLDYEPLRQLAALFGLAGIEFVLVLCSSTLAYIHLDRGVSRATSSIPTWVAATAFALLIIGSYLNVADTFYQRSPVADIPPSAPMSCILSQEALPGTDGWNATMAATRARVAAGDALVLWAEAAVVLSSPAEEAALLADGAALADGRAYIGLSYLLADPAAAGVANRFALVAPDGSVAWNYRKAYPVPFVEEGVVGGPPVLPFHDADAAGAAAGAGGHRLGLLSGAICFDLDHPGLVRQAGAGGAGLLLQPSWTWGAIGPRHFAGNAVRAVENGLTIFRCSSDGVSGVVGPGGRVLARALTGHDPAEPATFSVPIPAGAAGRGGRTVWVWGGFVVEWVVAAAAAVLLALPLLPTGWADSIVSRLSPGAAS